VTVARFSARDYLLRDWRWLLDLDVAGRVIRLAEEALEAPVGEDAALVPYLAGLEWAGEVPDSTDMRTIEVSLYLDQIDSTPQLIEDGLDLGGAVGTLRLWSRPSGQVVTVLVGQLRSVSASTRHQLGSGELDGLEEGGLMEARARSFHRGP